MVKCTRYFPIKVAQLPSVVCGRGIAELVKLSLPSVGYIVVVTSEGMPSWTSLLWSGPSVLRRDGDPTSR